MSDEEAMGKRRDIDKRSPLHSASPRGGEALKSEGKEEKEMGKTRAKVFSQGFFTEGKKRPFSLVKVSFCERKVLGGEKEKK